MSLLSEFEATPQKGTVGSHMRKNKQQIEMIHINDIRLADIIIPTDLI